MVNNGLYLRHYMGQQPGTSSSSWTSSPDIIPNGINIADVSQLKSDQGYKTEPPSEEYPGQTNYVYVRGKNISNEEVISRLWLYYAPSNVILWPRTWKYEEIKFNGEGQNYTEVIATAGQIVVSNPPFYWTPPALSPGVDHYCLVAFAENPPLSQNPIKSPLPNTNFQKFEELAAFVISNPNMAWRNTRQVSRKAPEWQLTSHICGADQSGEVYIGYKYKNMPTDGKLSLNVPGPDRENSISKEIQMEKSSDGALFCVTWAPGFTTTAVLNWQAGSKNPQGDANIEIIAGYSRKTLMQKMPHLFLKGLESRLAPSHRLMGYDSPTAIDGVEGIYDIIGTMQMMAKSP